MAAAAAGEAPRPLCCPHSPWRPSVHPSAPAEGSEPHACGPGPRSPAVPEPATPVCPPRPPRTAWHSPAHGHTEVRPPGPSETRGEAGLRLPATVCLDPFLGFTPTHSPTTAPRQCLLSPRGASPSPSLSKAHARMQEWGETLREMEAASCGQRNGKLVNLRRDEIPQPPTPHLSAGFRSLITARHWVSLARVLSRLPRPAPPFPASPTGVSPGASASLLQGTAAAVCQPHPDNPSQGRPTGCKVWLKSTCACESFC